MKTHKLSRDIIALQNIASSDHTRYNIGGVYFDPEGYAVASDGHGLVKRKCEVNGLSGSLVTFSKKKLPARADGVELTELSETKLVSETGISADVEKDILYPDYRQVERSFEGADVKISFDAGLLADIVQAMGSVGSKNARHQAVTLEFSSDGLRPIKVSLAGSDAQGLMMPMRQN